MFANLYNVKLQAAGKPKVDHKVLIPSRDFEKNTATFEMELFPAIVNRSKL